MDLTALVAEHEQRAAQEGPVTYALLRAMRYLQDGRGFVEGDFREWIAEGERLAKPPRDERTVYVPLTTGDDDRPARPVAALVDAHINPLLSQNGQFAAATKSLLGVPEMTPAQQRMAKARAARAAKRGAA